LAHLLPIALVDDENKAGSNQQAGFPVALEHPGQANEHCNDDERVRSLDEPEQCLDQRLGTIGQSVEDARKITLEPVEEEAGPSPDRNFVACQPFQMAIPQTIFCLRLTGHECPANLDDL